MLGAIAAEVRQIREQMDDALDGQAGRWGACGTDLTPDNRHNIRGQPGVISTRTGRLHSRQPKRVLRAHIMPRT
jgi:hypothetical protein